MKSKKLEIVSEKSPSARAKLPRVLSYIGRWLPTYIGQRLTRRTPRGKLHLMIAIADHFEPAIVPGDGTARASYSEQQRRLQTWCRQYPKAIDSWRDHDGRPFYHTYFYPAEQYDSELLDQLTLHCREGWGEIEVHLHHGMDRPDTVANTREQLVKFRDLLADKHGALSYEDGSTLPRYAFVHGNFALANSALGEACGVDSEMQVLHETGCYADLTLPTAFFHPAQISKVNSLYECHAPLSERAAHRHGRNLRVGKSVALFPLIVQGPLLPDIGFNHGRPRYLSLENGALTGANPPSLRRLSLWKRAAVRVKGRPDWLFIKLHCHSMDPTQHAAVLGNELQIFLQDLVKGASARDETLHFVTAREMVNIILAACEGREGNPGEYRDYRLKIRRSKRAQSAHQLNAMATKD